MWIRVDWSSCVVRSGLNRKLEAAGGPERSCLLLALIACLAVGGCGRVMDDPLPQGGSESSAGASGLVECSVDTVRVDVGDAPYCIDAVEVVRSAYRQFLAATPAQPAVPGCWWNTSLVPNGWSSGDHGDGALPATGVDWCDAAAFCQWKGRSWLNDDLFVGWLVDSARNQPAYRGTSSARARRSSSCRERVRASRASVSVAFLASPFLKP